MRVSSENSQFSNACNNVEGGIYSEKLSTTAFITTWPKQVWKKDDYLTYSYLEINAKKYLGLRSGLPYQTE